MSWQKILAQGFSSASDLLDYLGLPGSLADKLAEKQFPTRVPLNFAARMEKGNLNDPLLLQVLASEQELVNTPQYSNDPLQESVANPLPGLMHKYNARVLLTATGACAVNCRYCFRRHFPYGANNPGRNGWSASLDYIRSDSSIQEVILSGGDPLLAKDATLAHFIQALSQIEHVRILRFHSRIPIVLPERIDEGFLSLFASWTKQKVMVVHCNHPQEINEDVRQASQQLKQIGFTLLNQSVLLKSINDSVDTLRALSYSLFETGILPYYLHLLDKVQGAAHFDIHELEAIALYRELQSQLPGYLLPRLVREEPGRSSKTFV